MTVTLSIDQETRSRAASRAKTDRLSLSAATRMLLAGYADGRISITANAAPAQEYRVEEIATDAATYAAMERVSKAWAARNSKK